MGLQSNTDRIIMGVDPGTNIMGYGLIHVKGQQVKLIHMDIIVLKHPTHMLKLQSIFQQTSDVIKKYNPDEVAFEAPFFGKNVQSMLKLGRAQGIAMAAALHRNLPVFEYSPRKVKQSITGKGTSSKEQVAIMMQRLLSITTMPKKLDATDALAVAMCHYFQNRVGGNSTEKKYSGWASFVSDNAHKVSGL
jgi:crossover junction endodeoxyribonuclease RuvC